MKIKVIAEIKIEIKMKKLIHSTEIGSNLYKCEVKTVMRSMTVILTYSTDKINGMVVRPPTRT